MRRRTVNAAVSARQLAQRCRCRRIRSSQMVCDHDLRAAARYARRDMDSPRADIIEFAGPAEYITEHLAPTIPSCPVRL